MTSKTRQATKARTVPTDIVAEGPSGARAARATDTRDPSELVRETRGAMFVEYLTLICVVILGGSAAVVSLGTPLVHYYRVAQLVLGLPVP